MTDEAIAVIPARLNSKRFPHKVIYPFHGRPLISHVYREIKKSKCLSRVIVATDSKLVYRTVLDFGGEAAMTSARHRTGSDRVAEAMRKLKGDIIVNVQADNLGLRAAVIDRAVARMKADPHIEYATLARRLRSDSELQDPNVVKVVTANDGRALWFSRLPIPHLQQPGKGDRVEQFTFLAHIGVYLFRRRGLARFARRRRTRLEKAESLEQLRILEYGETMMVFPTTGRSVSVDTPRDLRKLEKLYR